MLVVLGASHHDLELAELEQLSTGADVLGRRLADLAGSADSPIAGAVLLATCNRIEAYLDVRRFHDAVDAATAAIAAASGISAGRAAELLTARVGPAVAAHLFTVAGGLDSLVVGEAEVSGQVSRALRRAHAAGSTTPALQLLFQSAARTAKRIVTTAGLGAAGRSVVSVALDVAARPGPDNAKALVGPDSRTLLIGTGAYARVVLAALRTRGYQRLHVFSPSGRAEAFAARHDIAPVAAADLAEAVAAADLVVACSGRSPGVLDAAALRHRDGLPLCVIDLALRSDISPEIRKFPAVRIIDQHTVAEHALPDHAGAIAAAQDVVLAAVARFDDEIAVRRLDPAVIALRRHISGAVDREMMRLRSHYDADMAAEVETAVRRVTRSLLHAPTVRARELARTGDGADYLQALHTLFGIEVSVDQAAPSR